MKTMANIIIIIMGIGTLLSAEDIELKGKIGHVEEIASPSDNTNILQVRLKTRSREREMVIAHLCPTWSLDMELKEGDEITVKGKFREENQFMVREMVRNNVRYRMRDENYEPLWLRTRLRQKSHFYNPQTEKQMKGKLEDLYIDRPSSMMEAKVRLENGELVRVRFAPEWYLRNRLRVGDKLELRGSEVKSDGETMILAREMRNFRTRQEVALRDRQGFPMWSGKGKGFHRRQPGHMGRKKGRGED